MPKRPAGIGAAQKKSKSARHEPVASTSAPQTDTKTVKLSTGLSPGAELEQLRTEADKHATKDGTGTDQDQADHVRALLWECERLQNLASLDYEVATAIGADGETSRLTRKAHREIVELARTRVLDEHQGWAVWQLCCLLFKDDGHHGQRLKANEPGDLLVWLTASYEKLVAASVPMSASQRRALLERANAVIDKSIHVFEQIRPSGSLPEQLSDESESEGDGSLLPVSLFSTLVSELVDVFETHQAIIAPKRRSIFDDDELIRASQELASHFELLIGRLSQPSDDDGAQYIQLADACTGISDFLISRVQSAVHKPGKEDAKILLRCIGSICLSGGSLICAALVRLAQLDDETDEIEFDQKLDIAQKRLPGCYQIAYDLLLTAIDAFSTGISFHRCEWVPSEPFTSISDHEPADPDEAEKEQDWRAGLSEAYYCLNALERPGEQRDRWYTRGLTTSTPHSSEEVNGADVH
ncbi:uncharacterized protein L969DRAFT_93703 [Mixia osmundae IAM 14324]|uniref:Uncharacterized protein n=1 Tax=Mixia osmundae (strain CBS 9802 / IAM 14324 / JCM 22182 / KY 12970) TaxID=764103 RepID=G7E9C2_MIXOS|nr:uncharacterized protein L969DRAFT_93703 [Mixia osmundae IAM 14324]KEI39868.1 hypothetical protein L969DRAFT_93703 [Mixia osmundae IAM 14324]GAA99241.1 hypothetical protein E5Q_05935 [Mixia osmundae IAM 14324]